MLTVFSGARESDETIEKELLPKFVVHSILHAGSTVKSCRTVLINCPSLLSCAISMGVRWGLSSWK